LYVTKPAPEERVTPAVFTKVALKGTAVVSGLPVLVKIKRVLLASEEEERLASTQTVADVGAVGETNGALAFDESVLPTVTSVLRNIAICNIIYSFLYNFLTVHKQRNSRPFDREFFELLRFTNTCIRGM
jgi:hypothetical protein